MEINNFDNISFNYYVSTSSYVKTILDILPESKVSLKKKAIIIEVFNFIVNSMSEEEISDMMHVSNMFNAKLELSSNKEIMMQVEYLYKTFLERMLFDSYNRKTYFDIMNECVKVYSGYYEEYHKNEENQLNDDTINNIRVKF